MKSGARWYQSLNRFHEYCGDGCLVLTDKTGYRINVVERGNEDVVADRFRNAGGIGNRPCRVARFLRREAHLPIVAVAVITALEFEDLAAPAIRAREADGKRIG